MADAPDRSPASLDPPNWVAFRRLAHRMLDETLDRVQSVEERPAWLSPPPEVRAGLAGPVPQAGIGEEAAYEEYRALVEPYTNGNRHPRFFGWAQGSGFPLASVAEFLASSMNPHMAGCDQSGPLVEMQVLDWLKMLLGFPATASGILLSGGTMANLTALAVARQVYFPGDYRSEGLQGRAGAPLVFYGSTQTHSWAAKSAEFLGLGRRHFVQLPTDAEYRIRLDELAASIQRDRQAGRVPFCVIGNAGTINTGAIDPLPALADLCREERVWFHVDGAFGALAALSARHRALVAGLERADSVAFDLHKWMSLPYEIGCVLVRDAAAHRSTFGAEGEYLRPLSRGVIRGGLPFAERGIELTRGFKALKVWMSLKAYGAERFGQSIARNIEHAQALVARVLSERELELLAPAPLSIVCLRYRDARLDAPATDALNEEILYRIQESGLGVISSTRLGRKFALRIANFSHRAGFEDLECILDAILREGRELVRNSKL
jgi:aromatic-L-amino-acid/L-tryptophan decarboxylase